jgi:hypothetical protein
MANTFIQIGSTITVGSGGASNIEFTSIPATYTDLVVKLSLRGAGSLTTNQIYMTFNNTTSGYASRQIYGDGSSVATAALNNGGAAISIINMNTSASSSNIFSSTDIYIPNYAGSAHKTALAESVTENNATGGALAGLTQGLLTVGTAITSIKFVTQDGTNFVQHSTAALYGVSNS